MTCGKPYPPVAKDHSTVVFDLDGTLAEGVWPDRTAIGEPIPEGVEMLRHYAGLGYSVVIDTARRPVDKEMIWEWVVKHDLPVDRVRCGRKIVAGLYVDDRAHKPDYARARYLEGNVGAEIKPCHCQSAYQDEKYGPGQRVHNPCNKGLRCTICGSVKEKPGKEKADGRS